MPELPEVETVRRLLEGLVVGKTVKDIVLYRAKNIETDPNEFVTFLKGKTITGLDRKGKVLAFLIPPFAVVSHLRMEGKFFYQQVPETRKPHDILRIDFVSGDCLVYNDTRKFGRLGLYPIDSYRAVSSFGKLGDEPFVLAPETLYDALQRHNGPIKENLLDQTIVAGIGNIYADETLFASRIHPLTPAKEITLEQCETILSECRRIMDEAIEEGGSTVRSYHPGNGINGTMQNRLLVYNQEGKPCPNCGFPLKKIFVNQRGTTYCPICQHEASKPFVIGVTGPIHSGKSTASKYLANKYVCPRFDADQVAKDAYYDPTIKKAVVHLLGRKTYVEKKPDFTYIRAQIAAKHALKPKLEAILHPYVYQQAKALIEGASTSHIILDVPLLFPSGMDELCDATILVTSDIGLRADRLREEGKDVDAMMKINSRYPLAVAKKKTSFIVANDLDLDSLYAQLDALPLP